MTDENPKYFRKSIDAPTKAQESIDSPRQLNASEDVSPLGTNAGGRPVSSRPKKT